MLFNEYDAISARRQALKDLEEEIKAYRLSEGYQLCPIAKNKNPPLQCAPPRMTKVQVFGV